MSHPFGQKLDIDAETFARLVAEGQSFRKQYDKDSVSMRGGMLEMPKFDPLTGKEYDWRPIGPGGRYPWR